MIIYSKKIGFSLDRLYDYLKRGGDTMVKEFVQEKVAQLREQANMTQRDLSLTLGMSESYINQVETGRTLPSLEAIEYICQYFQITVNDFFDLSKTNPVRQNQLIEATAGLQNSQIDNLIEIAKGYKLLNNQK